MRKGHMKILAVLLGSLVAQPALAQGVPHNNDRTDKAAISPQAPLRITVQSEWATPGTDFSGWGTSLAWFASTTGTWPDPIRERLADLFYGRDGLGWTIARYNIAGGRKPGTPPLSRANANIPGMWRMPKGATGNDWWRAEDPAMWDWDADPGQQWWLGAVRDRVPANRLMVEAAAYSPPWFMTVSGDVAGAAKPYQENLRPGFEGQFAEYLVRAMKGLEAQHKVRFHSLAPLNEPNTPYWVAGNRQEGAYFSPQGQAKLLLATAEALKRHRMTTLLSAMDETNPYLFVSDWLGYSDAARSVVGQLNTHTYSTTGSTGPRDVATATGLPLWMSEVDLSAPNTTQDFEDRASALALGEQIVLDLKRLEPTAWVLWQAVEPSAVGKDKGSNWGLVRADMSSHKPADMSVHVTSKYWAMANFSRYIKPGYRLVRNNDLDSITALSPDGREAVLVHVNHGPYVRRLILDTTSLKGRSWRVDTIVSDATHRAEQVGSTRFDGIPSGDAAPRGITTFRIVAVD